MICIVFTTFPIGAAAVLDKSRGQKAADQRTPCLRHNYTHPVLSR